MQQYYFISADGRQLGPIPGEQLINCGITPDTLVWGQNMSGWAPANTVPEIVALFTSQTQPTQPMPSEAPLEEPTSSTDDTPIQPKNDIDSTSTPKQQTPESPASESPNPGSEPENKKGRIFWRIILVIFAIILFFSGVIFLINSNSKSSGEAGDEMAMDSVGVIQQMFVEEVETIEEITAGEAIEVNGEFIAVDEIEVNGVRFKMIKVEGGTFTMGATSEQGSDFSHELPTHQVTLSDYWIGATEVTQELWEAVMGTNPSYLQGNSRLPVEQVSWDDCQRFIQKLNRLTGKNFRLPTEAEWEYAARGGNSSKGYKYSGSNTIGNVAWYADNSSSMSHQVGTKSPNELGIYDMSGNVYEWCSDWYGSYSSGAKTDPEGPSTGYYRVLRGGSWHYGATFCRVSDRDGGTPGARSSYYGFRLCSTLIPSQNQSSSNNSGYYSNNSPQSSVDEIEVNGVRLKMIKVDGGTFTMGATSEQGSDYISNELPTHQVTLSDYWIGATEVTQELWEAVMGNNPSYFTGNSRYPVERVSWDDCQTFIQELNRLTGKNFRLPTEAEWEFAARGGNSSKGYKYSGRNRIDAVAWYGYDGNSETTHEVATCYPNELGIYDMSGNVWEWCSDWYGDYSSGAKTDPEGPSTGSYRVLRGGSWYGSAAYCRVSSRSNSAPDYRNSCFGFRLCSSRL